MAGRHWPEGPAQSHLGCQLSCFRLPLPGAEAHAPVSVGFLLGPLPLRARVLILLTRLLLGSQHSPGCLAGAQHQPSRENVTPASRQRAGRGLSPWTQPLWGESQASV